MTYFLLYPVLFTVFRLLARLLGRLRTSGEESFPRTGPVIVCPNHVSDADPPVVFISLPRRAWFIGKSELFAIPFFGWLFAHFHVIPIKRDSADRAALRRAEAILKSGQPLVIFPEGRCSESGRLQRIQPGAALLSIRTGAPIVPVGLRHTNEMLPYRAHTPRFSRHRVTLEFGPPIQPEDFLGSGHSAAITAISEHLGQELARLTCQDAPMPPDGTPPASGPSS